MKLLNIERVSKCKICNMRGPIVTHPRARLITKAGSAGLGSIYPCSIRVTAIKNEIVYPTKKIKFGVILLAPIFNITSTCALRLQTKGQPRRCNRFLPYFLPVLILSRGYKPPCTSPSCWLPIALSADAG